MEAAEAEAEATSGTDGHPTLVGYVVTRAGLAVIHRETTIRSKALENKAKSNAEVQSQL